MILVLNCGSQSIKWKVFDKKLKLLADGKKEIFKRGKFRSVLKKELKSIDYDVDLVGHRVVHGGDKFRKPAEIKGNVLREIIKKKKLAPLHNPYNILGIKIAKRVFPRAKQIAVFDTAFYRDLPKVSAIYALPDNLRRKFKRFGFHGTSHEYAAEEAAKKIKKPFNQLKIISCHLGGGSSITAIKNGKAVDTSMGYTPMEGLVMMTRTGDIDPGIVLELVKKYGPKKTSNILNFKSGLKAISKESEMLKILKKKSKLSLELFSYKIKKYIGAYYSALNGCDILVFTGAIGAGDPKIRKMICSNLDILKDVKIIAIKPNEELAIAQKICLKS